MNILQSIFLGIIQGLTEFLPVSSSGHLVFFQSLLGLKEPPIFFDVMLHL
jgi:undecaprenyl-diphosphatase